MLILSRKPGEAILIDGGIRVVVLASDNGGARIGIDAPSRVSILREELALRDASSGVGSDGSRLPNPPALSEGTPPSTGD